MSMAVEARVQRLKEIHLISQGASLMRRVAVFASLTTGSLFAALSPMPIVAHYFFL